MVANRVNFVPGRDPSPSYLNRVQDPPTFNGTNRLDPYNSDELNAAWGISQRDGIKDYELDDRLPIGELARSGLVKGANVDPVSNLRIESATGAPAVYLTPDTPIGFVQVEVSAGSLVTLEGGTPNLVTWDDVELTIADDDETLCWVDENGIVQADVIGGPGIPAPTQVFTPLFRATVASGSLTNFDDLRPGVHTGYQPDNFFVLLNTGLLAENYTASSWERAVCDVRTNSFRITLPASPSDGDMVGVLDAYGMSDTNNILVDPTVNLINQAGALLTINTAYAHLVFVWVASEGSWYIAADNTGDSGSAVETFPLDYRLEAGDHTIEAADYRTWIDIDATLADRVVTLPAGLEFGFECYVQAIGGTVVFVTSEAVTGIRLFLRERESALLAWVDDTDEGGVGIWKLLEGLTPSDELPATATAPLATFNQETLAADKQLTNISEEYQILDPDGASRTVTLPTPTPQAGKIFTIVNNSDGLGGNDLVIDDGGGPVLTMNDASGIFNLRVLRTDTDWIFMNS